MKEEKPEPRADSEGTPAPQQPPRCCRQGSGSNGCSEPVDLDRCKLHVTDWLADIPGGMAAGDLVEVQFKNTRKGYYRNTAALPLKPGDLVAVEASPGHDIGTVTLTGLLVERQMKRSGVKHGAELKRIFRRAKPSDIDRYRQAKAQEQQTMIRARQIAASLGLKMKIGDVEYQGDGNKAIFYYIADERVDFRQLIKVLAETFRVRIEMKQIGARQEASRIGGIGPCGRPLCCSLWMSNFVSVGTAAARFQDISLNPQKLAGQCAKLKCCLNFEVDAYVEASRKLPPRDTKLETADSTWHHFKTDIFKKLITYSTDKHIPANLTTITAARAFEVIALNKEGEKPLTLAPEDDSAERSRKKGDFVDLVGQDSLSRFDKKKKKRKKKAAPAPADGIAPSAPKKAPADGAAPSAPKKAPADGAAPSAPKKAPADAAPAPAPKGRKGPADKPDKGAPADKSGSGTPADRPQRQQRSRRPSPPPQARNDAPEKP